MGMNERDRQAIGRWYRRLADRDARLKSELEGQFSDNEASLGPAMVAEAVGATAAPRIDTSQLSFETLVQKGRPALFINQDQVMAATPLQDGASKMMVDRVMAAADTINPWLPLIGRIDVANHPAGFPYVGTGWLIQPNLLCTNRHVAQLIGQQDGRAFTFSRGRFGKDLGLSFNRRREQDPVTTTEADVFAITGIAWIEPVDGPDLALLRVVMPDEGTRPRFLPIASDNGVSGAFVVTVGYPARAYEDTIPDQMWMDEIYGGIYDVKRAAPGQLDDPVDGSTTYDCTTLGGASGSPVLSLDTGKVLALHYAGLYKIENYGVPADVLRRYAAGVPTIADTPQAEKAPVAQEASFSITVPLTISVSLGSGVEQAIAAGIATGDAPVTLPDAVARLAVQQQPGVLAVKAGFDGRADCIVVAADPGHIEAVRAAVPAMYRGHRVEVRYATIDEQLGLSGPVARLATEAPRKITYDDTIRATPDFSLEPFEEDMEVTAHVGPEQGFGILADFLNGTQKRLTSSIYQFFSAAIAQVVEGRLKAGVSMRLVADPATRDPGQGPPGNGDFDRSETFSRWRDNYGLDNLYVRKGNGGLVASAYHIKVTVGDEDRIWLSSGNWTRPSEPSPDPTTQRAIGNREWHIVARSKRLATLFRAHIDCDYAQCKDLGCTQEAAVMAEPMVDVLVEPLVEAALPPPPPLTLSGSVKVTPLLTPDRAGRVYTDAVLDLIRSARDQLVFQNQYIHIAADTAGNLGELVDALVERSKTIRDVRVILRAGDVADDVAELRRRGMDVMRCVRVVANTHTKGIVADGHRVLIGSQNWSTDAVSVNRDASLLFDHAAIAGHFLKVFEIDWARARAAVRPQSTTAPPSVLVARGEAPPPGYVRMTLSDYRS